MQINPSINGWIEKFYNQYSDKITFYKSDSDFFRACQQSGLLYGFVVNYHLNETIDAAKWDNEEKIKVGFLSTLMAIYQCKKNKNSADFMETINIFYHQVSVGKFSFLKKILPQESAFEKLETTINYRLQTNGNFVSKSFTQMVTNILLFIDVLAFEYFLNNKTISIEFIKKLERKCLALILLSLDVKKNKSEYDTLLLKMFENSIRYSKISTLKKEEIIGVVFDEKNSILENLYLYDVAQITLLQNGTLYLNEQIFLSDFAKKINLKEQKISNEIEIFIEKYKNELPFFNLNHPVKQFYYKTQDNIEKLVSRNKTRLVKELTESKELAKLLRKSIHHDLSLEEKKKVKKQLLDICKTIPSLTIFLLPGGGLLLPILIKFIPQLLPSSFNENLNN